ncbi:molybdenum cofactor cytidylyltransferase [Thermanaeromonas toyohensis ToBE]|uniref:Molybdenum cofactor cytidylyltransferase n=1 Tax=Thermanaeromonas toyohensis ToBE TaxID=698762 RepID=A0A1W1W271_9FIRM|nr:nucleotidyltransferase family protein [Thermanaeromonas toyohensis]SMB99686.1 molybdenum cofactor cytidylyltransferase [Thermanaeromonas toyohensis ToBE]
MSYSVAHRAAVLLAAGESRRMGRPKALLPWGHSTLLEYNLQELVAAANQVVVVLGAHADRLRSLVRPPVQAVFNPDWPSGRVSSVLAGLRALGAPSSILIAGVDSPLAPGLAIRLFEAHAASGCPITVPTHGGRFGHPPVFDGSLLPELLGITEEGEGLREVLRRYPVYTLEVPYPSVLWNFNRPEDYEAAYRLVHGL